ncbi:MAG: histidine-type phosphatase [Bacteroides sp.]|nr:histidine-type phosphatase [Bacteroides sp.]MCM1413754.1 histidine-type phosphatase [Bacteroides sp.]MCM1472227.1 histidine-type phosphatase [Bacteroides sp.]
MKRLILSLLVLIFAAAVLRAAEPTMDNRRTASNYYAYPYPELQLPKLTATPTGYEPFHMEHYGRHGSRWHIGQWVYTQPIFLLHGAEKAGKLTPRGAELMEHLRKIEMEARGHDGELTQLGADQHRGIAKRMIANFPEIFSGEAKVNARSTDVVRCILSMENELMEMMAFNPSLDVTSDASKSTVRILNFNDTVANRIHDAAYSAAMAPVDSAFHIDYDAFVLQLVDDPQYVADSINSKELFNSLFRITSNAQSHYGQPTLYDLFTDRQLQDKWRHDNAEWFLRYGRTALTDGTGPMRQRYLMRDWIDSADSMIHRSAPGANLRFGHEVVVAPMATLMDLDSLGTQIDDLTKVTDYWRNYEIIPMGANIQMIFYRPIGRPYTDDEVLVKALLNEREVTLPATPVDGPYYRWTDVRKAYIDLIGEDGGRFPAEQPYLK